MTILSKELSMDLFGAAYVRIVPNIQTISSSPAQWQRTSGTLFSRPSPPSAHGRAWQLWKLGPHGGPPQPRQRPETFLSSFAGQSELPVTDAFFRTPFLIGPPSLPTFSQTTTPFLKTMIILPPRHIVLENINHSHPWAYFVSSTQESGCGGGAILYLSESHHFQIQMGLGKGINNFAELITVKYLIQFALENYSWFPPYFDTMRRSGSYCCLN